MRRITVTLGCRRVGPGLSQALAPWQRRTSLAIWIAFTAVYVVSLIGAGYLGVAYPLTIALLLVPVTLVFALIAVRRARRMVSVTVVVALTQFALGVLLLSGREGTWHIGGRILRSRFVLPPAAEIALWLAGTLLPLLISVWTLKQLKRLPER